jgi:hypothetical protein
MREAKRKLPRTGLTAAGKRAMRFELTTFTFATCYVL